LTKIKVNKTQYSLHFVSYILYFNVKTMTDNLMRLTVRKLLEDVDSYTKAFDEASNSLKREMHTYAREYYREIANQDGVMNFLDDAFIDDANLCDHFIAEIAFEKRNYVFILTELTQNSTQIPPYFRIFVLAHYGLYDQFLQEYEPETFREIINVIKQTKNYDLADLVWCKLKAWNRTYESYRTVVTLFQIFIGQTIEDDDWGRLRDYTEQIHKYINYLDIQYATIGTFKVYFTENGREYCVLSQTNTKESMRNKALRLAKFAKETLDVVLMVPRLQHFPQKK